MEIMKISTVMTVTATMMMVSDAMKKKKINYQKALEKMERETARAVAHVEALSKLYAKTRKAVKPVVTRT